VGDGVGEGVGDGVGDSVGDGVGVSVGDSVDGIGDGVGDGVGESVGDGVGEGVGDGVCAGKVEHTQTSSSSPVEPHISSRSNVLKYAQRSPDRASLYLAEQAIPKVAQTESQDPFTGISKKTAAHRHAPFLVQ